MPHKVYVEVLAKHDVTGRVEPLSVTWEDGRCFTVDRVLDVRQAASRKVGGQGTRYTLRILGKDAFLFHDEGKWFMEGK